jgi:transposase
LKTKGNEGVEEMPQELLPLFVSSGDGYITDILSYQKENEMVYDFHAGMPIFCHGEKDKKSFRMFTSQLVVNGSCRQMEIVRAFGVSAVSMKRWVKKYREGGPEVFFKSPRTRGSHVLTAEVTKQAQELLSQGKSRPEVAKQLNLKLDTLSKAIRSGRLSEPVKKKMMWGAAKANAV